jgi:hypothetical protein
MGSGETGLGSHGDSGGKGGDAYEGSSWMSQGWWKDKHQDYIYQKESTMRSCKHTFLVVITSGGLAVGMLGMAYAEPAGSIKSEITISNNRATTVRDTGGIGFELTGVTKRLIGIKAQQGDPNQSETVVQGVRHNGSLPADKITIHDTRV